MKKLLGILVLVLVVSLACTAFADGKEVKEGELINWGDIDEITKIGDHVIDSRIEWLDKEPTCTEYGSVTYDCTDGHAGQHQHTLRVRPLGHDWASEQMSDDEWGNVIVKPTCTETGLAQDVCLRCGATREKYRVIEKLEHEYDDDHYIVYKAPTCTATGLGQHICIFCGEPLKDEKKEDMVVIPMIPHNFTEWNIIKHSTCDEYGVADRACIWCGMHQILDEDHPLTETDKDGNVINLLDTVKGVAILNPNWVAEAQEFDTEALYQAWLKSIDFEYEISKKWLQDCYTRILTFTCPYCHGEIHDDFEVTLVAPITIAHVWKKVAEPFYPDGLSLAPTCTQVGYYAYLCIYDEDGPAHGHDGITAGSSYEDVLKQGITITSADGKVSKLDPQVKIEKIPATGHKWSPWCLERTYTKDGKTFILNVRTCDVCGENEEEVREITPADGKNGLILDEDGKWRYYEGNELVDKTKVIGLETGDFWIINGELAFDANGLTYCPDHVFYFLSKGQIQRVSDVVSYDSEWFKIVNGTLDLAANGLYDYDGGKFVFAAGRLRTDVNGLWQNPQDGKWYFLANGQVQAVSQVVMYDGAFFVVENGVLNTGYNGTIEYDGAIFNVVNGQLFPIA